MTDDEITAFACHLLRNQGPAQREGLCEASIELDVFDDGDRRTFLCFLKAGHPGFHETEVLGESLHFAGNAMIVATPGVGV